jgi:hypothetical protein
MKYTLIICLALAAIWLRSTDKETPDWTGTTQGEYVFDSIEDQREMDSIDDYMRHWYEVLDTNSDGDIDE